MTPRRAPDQGASPPKRAWLAVGLTVAGLVALLLLVGLSALVLPRFLWPQAINDPQAEEDLLPPEDERGRIWPGMILFDRKGHPAIHISTDGTPESGVSGLVVHLADQDAGIRESAAGWLGAMGFHARDALPALKKASADPDAKVRVAAMKAVKRIEADAARRKAD
jgi:hypothetical protein